MEFSRPEYWSGEPFPSPGDLPNPEIEPRFPTLQADSLPAESPGKPNNTGVGSLTLLQGIFLTQESNGGRLHCRWILYQLSYQGSPCICIYTSFFIRPFVDRHLDCSHVLAIVNNAAKNTGCRNILSYCLLLFAYLPRVKSVHHVVVLILLF